MNNRKQLGGYEGRRNTPYRDTLGIWTCGIGHVGSDVVPGQAWSDERVDSTFDRDAREKEAGIRSALDWFDEIPGAAADDGTTNARQSLLIQMAFQLGVHGALQFKQTLEAVREGRFEEAASGMLNSLVAKQTPRRWGRMAEQMRTGEWQ